MNVKFRAWDDEKKVMMYDDKTAEHDIDYFDGIQASNIELLNHLCGKLELMQFTGIEDKNGKDIYRGDLMAKGENLEHDRVVVEWKNHLACFQINGYYQDSTGEDRCEENVLLFGSDDELELIGNIYE